MDLGAVEYLCCPACKGKFEFALEEQKGEIGDTILISPCLFSFSPGFVFAESYPQFFQAVSQISRFPKVFRSKDVANKILVIFCTPNKKGDRLLLIFLSLALTIFITTLKVACPLFSQPQAFLHEREKKGRQHHRDLSKYFDQNIERRPRRVLERISHCIADNRGLVRIRSLTSVGA